MVKILSGGEGEGGGRKGKRGDGEKKLAGWFRVFISTWGAKSPP